MVAGQGYVQKRRGILEHLTDGRMTALEYAAYDVMILRAEKATGIWVGSAAALAVQFGAGDIPKRQARHILESLESKGYVKRFPVLRSHRNYPILINRFFVSSGAQSGTYLNATATVDYRFPVYDKCPEHGPEHGPELAALEAQRTPLYETRDLETRELKQETKSISRKRRATDIPELFAEFWEKYPRKLAREKAIAAWRKLDSEQRVRALDALLKYLQSPKWRDPAGLEFIPYAATWLNQKRFYEEPELLPLNGGSNGRRESFQEQRDRESKENIDRAVAKYTH